MVQISIPKQYERARKFVAIPVREYELLLRRQQARRTVFSEADELLRDSLDLQAAIQTSSGEFVDARAILDESESSCRVPSRTRTSGRTSA